MTSSKFWNYDVIPIVTSWIARVNIYYVIFNFSQTEAAKWNSRFWLVHISLILIGSFFILKFSSLIGSQFWLVENIEIRLIDLGIIQFKKTWIILEDHVFNRNSKNHVIHLLFSDWLKIILFFYWFFSMFPNRIFRSIQNPYLEKYEINKLVFFQVQFQKLEK